MKGRVLASTPRSGLCTHFVSGLAIPVVMAIGCAGTAPGIPTAPSTDSSAVAAPAAPATPAPPVAALPTEWDPSVQGLPRFISHQYIDLDGIGRISRFRSGFGHNYSDAFESCRSMKHYFSPRPGVDAGSIRVYSPVDGEVVRVTPEWAGTQIRIRPAAYPAFEIILFHARVTIPLEVGTRLSAGQPLGTHVGSQTSSDVAVGVANPSGWQLVSWFDVLDEAAFDAYRARGVTDSSDVIISRSQRDSQPLNCSGEQFQDEGGIVNWVELR